jgi:O-antigen/teichoic acid export membrane protein
MSMPSPAVPAERSAAVEERSIYQRILQASAIYSIATFAPLATGIVTLPVYSHFLQPSDYGILELLDATRTIIAMIIGARFSESLLYSYGRAKSDSERQASACTVVYGSLLLGLMAAALGWVSAPALSAVVFQTAKYTPHFRLVCFAFGLSLPIEAVMAWLRALDRAGAYVRLAVGRLVLGIIGTAICIIPLRMHVMGMLVGGLAATTLIAIVGLGMFWVSNPFSFDSRLFIEQLRLGFLLTATGGALFIINFGDRFFLERYQPLAQVGLYGLAYKCGMAVSIAQAAFSQYWYSQVYDVLGHADRVQRFRRIHMYLLTILSYLAVVISASATVMFRLAFPPDYWPAALLVPWIAMIYILRAHGDYFRSALYVEGRPGTDTWINVFSAVICGGLYMMLIPRLGATGALLATAIAFLVVSLLTWRAVAATKAYTVELRPVVKLCIITAAMSIAPLMLQSSDVRLQLLLAVAEIVGFPIALRVAGVLNSNEVASIRNIAIQALRSVMPERQAKGA